MSRVYEALIKSGKELPFTPTQEAQRRDEKTSALRVAVDTKDADIIGAPETELSTAESKITEENKEVLWHGPSPTSDSSNSVSAASALKEQTDSLFGQALPDIKTSRTAGATLGAVGSARSSVKFISKEIDAARVEPHLVAITQPRSRYCEEFRSLRTHVLHASKERKMQTIVIASAGAGEGKSLTALNLSWLLAQTDGVNALVIDGDLRHPCLHDYLGVKATIGLSDIFSDRATIEDTIIQLNPSGLHLLPGGRSRDDVAELLSGPRFTQLLNHVRKMFDFIIIDAPPLGVFTDATVLIGQSDGALLVVRAGKTRYAIVNRLLSQLPRERMLGVVVNRSQDQANDGLEYYGQRERNNGTRQTNE